MIDSKILIIGNGNSTKDYELGQKIDSEFDIIVRFNRGYFEGIINYEKYIGSKTDILIIHDGFAKPEYITDEVLNSVSNIFVVIPQFKFDNEYYRIKSYGWNETVQIIPKEYEIKLNELANFGNKWPTTGLIGLYFISNNFDDVSIYGFDGGDEKYEYYHYYTHSDDRTTKYMNRPTRFDHDFSIERKCMDIIKKTYSLKNLNE